MSPKLARLAAEDAFDRVFGILRWFKTEEGMTVGSAVQSLSFAVNKPGNRQGCKPQQPRQLLCGLSMVEEYLLCLYGYNVAFALSNGIHCQLSRGVVPLVHDIP